MSVVEEIAWGDGSGDKIYITSDAFEGDQSVLVSSDANTGNARSKTITFTSLVGNITKVLTISQIAGEVHPNHDCLTFRSSESNTLSMTRTGTSAPTLYWSTDGVTWTLWDYSALSFSVGHPLFIYGSNTSGFSSSDSNYSYFVMGGSGSVSCDGSVATLINGTTTLVTIPNTYCFYSLFRGCSALVSAPTLPSTTLKDYCYYNLFRECTSLVTPPALPATSLKTQCYRNLFYGCTSLTSAPELKATSVNASSYRAMFYGCTSLTTAPSLPATTLNTYCYYQMFYGCSGLVNAPTSLPATTLKNYCYYEMFRGCSKITTAPVLPAETLTTNCYYRMFYNCSSLNYVKALFTTTPTSGSSGTTTNWLSGVASTGTFVKNSSATWTTTGSNGVPNGWTIQVASS